MCWRGVGRRVGGFLEVLTGPCLKWEQGATKTGTERTAGAKALRWQQLECPRNRKKASRKYIKEGE